MDVQALYGQQNPQQNSSHIKSPIEILKSLSIENKPMDEEREKNISLETLTDEEIDKIMKAFIRGKEEAKNYYESTIEEAVQHRHEAYIANEKYYRQFFPALSEYSDYCSRDIKTSIDWIVPSFMEAFTGTTSPIDIKGENINDDEKAKLVQQLVNYQLTRKNKYTTVMNSVLKDALQNNYGIAKIYWKRREEEQIFQIQVFEKDLKKSLLIAQEERVGHIEILNTQPLEEAPDINIITYRVINVKENYPVFAYLKPSELRFTPDAAELQDAKFVAHRKIVHGDYLNSMEQEGIFSNVAAALKEAGDTTHNEYDISKNEDLETISQRLSDGDLASKEVELYEAYLKVDYNNDGIFENVIVHAVGNIPVSIQLNELEIPPFFICQSEKDPAVIFNKDESFTDNLEQQQKLKTALLRQLIINIAKNNSPQKFVANSADIDALINGDEIVPVDSDSTRDVVYTPPQLPISPLTMTALEYAQNEIESQSGSTKYNQGLDSNSLNKTATGLTAIMNASEKRNRYVARQICENFLMPAMKYIITLNQKYADDQTMFRLLDKELSLKKEDLNIGYDLVINVGTGASTKEAQIQYYMVFINSLMPALQQMGIADENSWYKVTKVLLETMGIRNVESYLNDPTTQEFMQKQQAKQQQALQAKQLELQAEIAKEKVPNISLSYKDLPIDAKLNALKQLGIDSTLKNLETKEVIENA